MYQTEWGGRLVVVLVGAAWWSMGCGSSDDQGDARADATTTLDGGRDIAIDAAKEIGSDATSDVTTDAASDVAVDGIRDVTPAVDAPSADMAPDAPVDTPNSAVPDAAS